MMLPELKSTRQTDSNSPWPSFEKMVNEDIQKCEEYLSGERGEQQGLELHLELITKYPAYIPNFGDSLYNYSKDHGFVMQDYFGLDSAIHNLIAIKNKLIAFRNYGYKNPAKAGKQNSSRINIENNLTATQTQTVTVSFEAVKRQIECMSGLSDSETKETLEKIDEIQAIVELKEPKKTKWQKIKPILVWLADKSVDVGIAVLPLLLKIGGQA